MELRDHKHNFKPVPSNVLLDTEYGIVEQFKKQIPLSNHCMFG